MQAPQELQDQSVSAPITSPISAGPAVPGLSAARAAWARRSRIRSRGAERRAAGGGGAGLVAAAALGAGIEVEQILPRELRDVADPDLGRGVVRVVRGGGPGEAAQGVRVAGRQRAEHGDQVLRLGPGDRGNEGQCSDAVDPPIGPSHRGGGRLVHAEPQHDLGESPADRRPYPPGRLFLGEPHPLLEEAGEADQQQRPQEERVVAQPGAGARPQRGLAAIVPPVSELRGPDLPAPPHHVDDARDQSETGEVGDQAEDEIEGAVPEGEAKERLGDVVLDRDDAGRGEQQEEAVHDRRVGVTRRAVPSADGPLGDHVGEHAPEPAPWVDRNRAPARAGIAPDMPGDSGRAHRHGGTRHDEEEGVAEGGDLPEELASLHAINRQA